MSADARGRPDPRPDKSIHARWTGAMSFETRTGMGGAASMEGRNGRDGARPSELLLVALAGCTAMDVISILLKKRQRVSRYEVRTWGEQRSTRPATFSDIVVEHELEGDELEEEAVRRSIELSATRYCPVTAHLAQGETRISHRYAVGGGDEQRRAEVVVTGPHGAGLDPEPTEG